jgi:hypothetical protein
VYPHYASRKNLVIKQSNKQGFAPGIDGLPPNFDFILAFHHSPNIKTEFFIEDQLLYHVVVTGLAKTACKAVVLSLTLNYDSKEGNHQVMETVC